MGYRRRYNPAAEARREREAADERRFAKARRKLARLLSHRAKIEVHGEEAKRAWSLPARRSFEVRRTSQGDVVVVIVRGSGREMYLQEPTFSGWIFSRLVPRSHEHREMSAGASSGAKAWKREDYLAVRQGMFAARKRGYGKKRA